MFNNVITFLWHFFGGHSRRNGIWESRIIVVIFKYTISQAKLLRFFCTDTTRSFGETRKPHFFKLCILFGMNFFAGVTGMGKEEG